MEFYKENRILSAHFLKFAMRPRAYLVLMGLAFSMTCLLFLWHHLSAQKNQRGLLTLNRYDRSDMSVSDTNAELIKNLSMSSGARKNLVFIKSHKCGTSTIVSILYLAGVRRRANFLVEYLESTAKGEHKLKWELPEDGDRKVLPPRPGKEWNIQCQHGSFYPEKEHKLMPKATTLYTVIIRSTVSHFKSAFNFFGADKRMKEKYPGKNLTFEDTVKIYLNEVEYMDSKPLLSLISNNIAMDLGWKGFAGKQKDKPLEEIIKAFVEHLDREMDFVMLTDRLDESLVILAEYMGWELTDILYLKRMVSKKITTELSEESQRRILDIGLLDQAIYQHFSAKFEEHVNSFGRERLEMRVKEFQDMRQNFEDACFDKSKILGGPYGSVSWELSDYGKHINRACEFLQIKDVTLTKVVTEAQLSEDYNKEIPNMKGDQFLLKDMVLQIQRDFVGNRTL